ncbi:MAG: GW dipeptide domain-containing protein [Minisyncoccia bacterium]
MADEKKFEKPADKSASTVEKDPFVEVVWFIISILFFVYLLNGFLSAIRTNSFLAPIFGVEIKEKTVPMSKVVTLIGGKVLTSKDTSVLSSPGGVEIASEPKGAKATIIEGPIIKDGVKYWHVKFEDGVDGWVGGGSLSFLENIRVPLSKSSNPKDGRVLVSKNRAVVFADPGVNQITTEPRDANGKVVDGPSTKDGVKYWKIQFDDGTTGWVAEDDLDQIQEKVTPLSDKPSIIGGKVLTSKNDTPIYDSPGGKQIGTEKADSRGTIIDGPLVWGGVKYWHIKFDDGKEGWVSENDLGYIDPAIQSPASKVTAMFWKIINYLKYLLIAFLIISVGSIVYLFRNLTKLRLQDRKSLYPDVTKTTVNVNPQWKQILAHIESPNENDWRLAILEADIMLSSLLEKLSLPGDTIGDKLKAIEKSDFTTVDNAWEAHKIRNQIAHEGQLFALSQREAKRVVELYSTVFKEFQII